MAINYLLILFLILLIYCCIHGARTGMLNIIYGLVAWIFAIWFIHAAGPYITTVLETNTTISTNIEETINNSLQTKYQESEENQQGTGEDAVMALIPSTIKDNIETEVQSSIDATIAAIAKELTYSAMQGLATLISIIIAFIAVFIVGKIIRLIGGIPGLRSINKFFGIFAGFIEALMIIWFIMFIADCFPASAYGQFVIGYAQSDQMLNYIYMNNIIKGIVGI
ncbi:MAG: CvpA family protein [Pseudobutyrivibrio sp.]|nr:CvpA family protein [Pseudobutyrivibrio sp.]